MRIPDLLYFLFQRMSETNFCLLHFLHFIGTEVYANPAETSAAGVICDCSEVHVSACVTTSLRSFCAINEKGCRPGWPHYSPHTQRYDREYGVGIDNTAVDCRLCKKKNTEEPTPSPTHEFKPSARPTASPTKLHVPTLSKTPTTPSIEIRNEEKQVASKGNDYIGAIVGGTIAGLVVISIMSLYYVKAFRGVKRSLQKNIEPPPPVVISYSCGSNS